MSNTGSSRSSFKKAVEDGVGFFCLSNFMYGIFFLVTTMSEFFGLYKLLLQRITFLFQLFSVTFITRKKRQLMGGEPHLSLLHTVATSGS